MKKFVAAVVMVGVLAVPAVASAAPSRTHCEQVAIAIANGSGYPRGSGGWDVVYTLAYSNCMQGRKQPDYRRKTPPKVFAPFFVPGPIIFV